MESDTERVLAVLDQYGVEYKREAGNRAKLCCPFHDEKTPSMTVYDNNSCYCFGCQRMCWHDELIAKIAHCSIAEAKKKLGIYDPTVNYDYLEKPRTKFRLPRIEFSDPIRDFSDAYSKLPDEIPPQMTEFLTSKGLQDLAPNLGGWRWHPKGTFNCWPNSEGICIPFFGPNMEICTFRLRKFDRMRGKFTHPIAPKGVPLQASYLINDISQPFYFCEGETDSLSVHSTGRNVICLPGVGAHKQLHSAIMQCLEWQVPKLIFCGDNDEAGATFNEYATSVAITLGLGIFCPQIRVLKIPEEYNMLETGAFKRKDLNDFLVEGRLGEILDAFEATDTKSEHNHMREQYVEKMPQKPNILDNITSIMGNVEDISNEIQGELF